MNDTMKKRLPPDDDRQALDPALLDAFAEAHHADPVSPGMAAQIKRRLLGRIADIESGHLTVRDETAAWKTFLPGVKIKVLHEAHGVMSYVLQLAPGASVPAHHHPLDEECVVLEGVLHIGELVVAAGDYHLARRDALHATLRTETGSTIFLRGATPSAEQVI